MIAQVQDTKPQKWPLWSQLIISFTVLAYLTVGTVGIATILQVRKMVLEAIDPKCIALVAKGIAHFPQKLPLGFVYKLGVNLGAFSIVGLEHVSDEQEVFIICNFQDEVKDAKTTLQRAYDMGLATPTAVCHFKEVKARGEISCGGQKMPYLIGALDTSGKVMEGFVGCILVSGTSKGILVYGLQPPGVPYKLDETTQLLKSISGF